MTRDGTTEERLDELESWVDRQRERLADQRATIAAQRDRIERLESERTASKRDGPAENDSRGNTDSSSSGMSRRSVLQGLGVAGLLSFGAGTGSASDPRGVVGSADQPVDTLYLDTLSGSLTGGSDLTTLAGDGLALSDGALQADATNVGDEEPLFTRADDGTLQFRTVRGDGSVDVSAEEDELVLDGDDSNSQTDVSDDGSTVVSSTDDINFGSNLDVSDDGDGSATVDADVQGATNWEDGGSDLLTTTSPFTGITVDDLVVGDLDLTGSTTIDHADLDGHGEDDHHTKDHDHTEGDVSAVPNGGLANDSVSVAGNSVSLGGSTGISHGDLDGLGTDNHHAKDHDHSEGDVSAVSNAGLSNSSVTVTPGNGLENGGTAPLGGSVTLDVEADGIGTSELDTPFSDLDVLFEGISTHEPFITTGGLGIDLNGGIIRNQGRISDDSDVLLSEGFTFYQSAGTNDVLGDAGDVVIESRDGTLTKQLVLYDYDNGATSSARYKKQIEPASEADIDPRGILDVPVRTWTDASTDSQSFGFIAEEVQEAIGDMAVRHKRLTEEEANRAGETYLEEYDVEAGNEVPNSLVQMVLLGCTVSVLQDQQEQIDTLQDENERLRERNATLESRLKSIESHLGLANEQAVADD